MKKLRFPYGGVFRSRCRRPAGTSGRGSIAWGWRLICTTAWTRDRRTRWKSTGWARVNWSFLSSRRISSTSPTARPFAIGACRVVPLKITVVARIPVSRGLGSSAAATSPPAGALARPLLSPALTLQEAATIGTELEGHPDNLVPALVGGMTAAVSDGDQVHWVQLGYGEKLRVVVLIPSHRLATKKARAVLPKKVTMEDAVYNLSRAALLSASLAKGETETLAASLGDRLHQPYRARLVPGLTSVLSSGAPLARSLRRVLSGAGTDHRGAVSGPSGPALADDIAIATLSRKLSRDFVA